MYYQATDEAIILFVSNTIFELFCIYHYFYFSPVCANSILIDLTF